MSDHETDDDGKEPLEKYDDWKQGGDDDVDDPQELFRKAAHISLCISYDLIDKLRYWEKDQPCELPELCGDSELSERIWKASTTPEDF